MDDKKAANLLAQIHQKTADDPSFSPITNAIHYMGSFLPSEAKIPDTVATVSKKIQEAGQKELKDLAMKRVISQLITAGGLGAGARGVYHLLHPPTQVDIENEVDDIPITINSPSMKAAEDEITALPTTPYGLDWYIPSMLLGTPLAAYAGWKGVDSLLGQQQKAKSDDELERMKARYQAAIQELSSSSKTAGTGVEKEATIGEYIVENLKNVGGSTARAFNNTFPNAAGISKGLILSYILGTAPLGYMAMSSAMKKKTKKKLLEESIEERARRHEQEQPTPIYALPQ